MAKLIHIIICYVLTITLAATTLAQNAFALRPIAAQLLEQQSQTAYSIKQGVFKATSMPEPSRQKLLDFIKQNTNKLSDAEQEALKSLRKTVFAIEAGIGLLKYAGVLPAIAGIFSGSPVIGAVAGGIIFFSTGILRLSVIIRYKIRNPKFQIRSSLYFLTLMPLTFGFTYTIAYLYSPYYRFGDLMLIRNIIYKVHASLYRSALEKDPEFDMQYLIDNADLIASDILRYQKVHFGMFTSKYRRFFRIRSAEWTVKKEAAMYAHLSRGKRFLFIDSDKLLSRFVSLLKARFGSIMLSRVYYYDIRSFIKDISRIRSASNMNGHFMNKETYIKHMFTEYDITQHMTTGSGFEELEMHVLRLLYENSKEPVTLAALENMLEHNISTEELLQILDSLLGEGLIDKIEIKSQAKSLSCRRLDCPRAPDRAYYPASSMI